MNCRERERHWQMICSGSLESIVLKIIKMDKMSERYFNFFPSIFRVLIDGRDFLNEIEETFYR